MEQRSSILLKFQKIYLKIIQLELLLEHQAQESPLFSKSLEKLLPVIWDTKKAIASHFESAEDAVERLSAAGLMSVPEWAKPFQALSNGQQFRAGLARSLHNGAVLDEFTSVVDRNVAKAASTSMARYVRRNGLKQITIATCHRDVLEFLEPDWVIDTDRGEWTSGRYLQRPQLVLDIYPCSNLLWSYFAKHHYLSESLNKASHNYMAIWEGKVVGFHPSWLIHQEPCKMLSESIDLSYILTIRVSVLDHASPKQ
jgi:energy-coupling factor transporter ATP-binding protein EcfA2